jgi:hypothetical protein
VGGLARIVSAVVVLAVAAGVGARSTASFAAQGANAGNKFAYTALYAPTGLTATPSGHNVNLSWTAGTNGSGYSVLGYNNGTSTTCSTAFSTVFGSPTTTSYTDSGRYLQQGTYECYQVKTTYGSAWTSVNTNPTAFAQLGVVAKTAVASNSSSSGNLNSGDKIVITFNQAITTTTGPVSGDTVCTLAGSGTIMLGSTTTSGTCSTSETVDLGKLTGGTTASTGRWTATYVWSGSNTILTVTLGTLTGSNSALTGTWTFTPTTTSSKLQSSTGGFSACNTNTGGGNCLPTMTGGF